MLRFHVEIYLAEHFGVSADYAAELRRTARQFAEWAGDPVPLAEVGQCLAAFLRHIFTAGASPVTVNNKRRELLTLLEHAGFMPHRPPPKLREPSDEPTAWTVEEVGELLWTARHVPGEIGGVPAGLWWDSLFSAVYWTGARIGALRRAAKLDYHAGYLTLRGSTQKNARGKAFRLHPDCAAKVERLVEYRGPLLWPWPFHYKTLFPKTRRIIERAGLEAPHSHLQLFYRLRRTNLSYCAAADFALAQRQAGHASPETTRRYISPLIARETQAADVLPVPRF
jgi:integrase